MKIVKDAEVLQKKLLAHKAKGERIAVVPTMGALHEGHLSLIKKARTEGDIVVVTLFVNPTQFGPNEDLDKYPRTFESDCEGAESCGADYLFAPMVTSVYPEQFDTVVHCGGVTSRLEGASRPGHFDGVTTIVLKLFNMTVADVAVFGQKDAQQVLVIKKMVRDLNVPVNIIVAPTVREESGLAMSSRNRYLTKAEKVEAAALSQGLFRAKDDFDRGENRVSVLRDTLEAYYAKHPLLKIEYIAVTDRECIAIDGDITNGALLSLACRTKDSQTRLIDNVILGDL